MAFGLGEGTLALMDVGAFVDGTSDSAALRFTVEAARSFMNPIVISPDSTRIATVPRNEPIRIWSASDGAPIAEFDVRVADGGVGFHPTEPWVYVADGTDVVVHTLDVDQLLAMAATDAGRRLTDDECRQYLHRSCD
jgi:WD40 repeat protein